MRKKVTVCLLGLCSLMVLGSVTQAHARCDQGGPTAGHQELVQHLPVTGTHTYYNYDADDPGATTAYVGVHGSTGYIEANSDAGNKSGSIQGGTNDGAVDGKVSGDSGGARLCVQDTVIL
jgi:hypothetical protein